MRRRISVAATPTGDSKGEVELNSVEQTTERRENQALSTAEHGSQAHSVAIRALIFQRKQNPVLISLPTLLRKCFVSASELR